MKVLEKLFLVILFLITVLPRFLGLGYSEFYGDETKAIYWNKAVPATQFLLNQRKGPVQFLVVWFMEKVSGGFGEFAIRLPFAVAGTLSVFVLYFVVRKWFNWRVAFIAAFLFSINGIFIAFSRTAQYQSFLWLFGFLAIWAAQNKRFFFAGTFLALGFLSHYDAIFFAIPVLYTLLPYFKKNLKNLTYFAIPLVLLVGSFYAPYFLGGNFGNYTSNYIQKRMSQQESAFSSLYTYSVYNPYVISLPIVLLGALFFVFHGGKNEKVLFGLWFGLPFVVFELVFRSPGTHIQQYLIPLIIMSGYVINELIGLVKKWGTNDIVLAIFVVAGLGYLCYSFSTFIPALNKGYPWRNEELGRLNQSLYLYGFPYHRGWKQVNEHLTSVNDNEFYTNDNLIIASYYLRGISLRGYKPKYYVDISQNQLFKEIDRSVFGPFEYVLDKTIEVDGRNQARIYRKTETLVPVL